MTTVVLNTVTRKVEVFSSARDVQARAEIADHKAAADPHPQYLADADIAEVALSGDAGDLIAGTVPDARMPNWTGYNLSSRTALEAASVPAAVVGLRLLGYSSADDGGGALYKRVASEPSHAGKIQSADGAWWEIAETVLWAEQFGAVGDGSTSTPSSGTDNTTALQNWLDAARLLEREMRIGPGVFSTDALTYPHESLTHFNLQGSGPKNSIIRKRTSDGGNLLTIGNTTTQAFMEGGAIEHVAFYGIASDTPEVLATHSPNQWRFAECEVREGVIGHAVYNGIGNKWDRVLAKGNQKGMVFTRKVYPDASQSQPNLNIIAGSWIAANSERGLEFDWGKMLLIESTNFAANGTNGNDSTGSLWVGPNLSVDNGNHEIGVECSSCWFEGNFGYVVHLEGKSNTFTSCKWIANNSATRDLISEGGVYSLINSLMMPDKPGGNIEDAAGTGSGNQIIGGSIRNTAALDFSKTFMLGLQRGTLASGSLAYSDRQGVKTETGDTGVGLNALIDPPHLIHSGTLTANRGVTLTANNVYAGARFNISRTGGGAFALLVNAPGPVTIAVLATDQWCEVVYDGTSWVLIQFGSL